MGNASDKESESETAVHNFSIDQTEAKNEQDDKVFI